jgi:F-type H+-transporting ATPase subunit alpha
MAIDAAIPIGRGQRELVIGDRNVGKTALAVDLIAAQQPGDVACVYVVIGQPMSRVLALRDTLERAGCLTNTAIVAAHAGASPGLQYLAPYAGATIAEWFRDQGGHALVIYDDLTKHADAYRELALLLDRPPGREAFPGDIFYVHAELLERSAALTADRGGGTVTAFPLVETTDGDIAAYIPTNLISITDGQIYLDAGRFERDLRPAIDIGRSVSRIGAVAQPEAMRAAARNLKIRLSQFESLERLSRVGLDIDVATRSVLLQGQILRALLRQPRLSPRGIARQVIALTAVSENWLACLAPGQAVAAVEALVALAREQMPHSFAALDCGALPTEDWKAVIANLMPAVKSQISKANA